MSGRILRKKTKRTLTITSPKDSLGRCHFTLTWPVELHPCCPRCGKNVNDHVNPSTVCANCGLETRGQLRGQCYFARPEDHAA